VGCITTDPVPGSFSITLYQHLDLTKFPFYKLLGIGNLREVTCLITSTFVIIYDHNYIYIFTTVILCRGLLFKLFYFKNVALPPHLKKEFSQTVWANLSQSPTPEPKGSRVTDREYYSIFNEDMKQHHMFTSGMS